MIKLSASRIKTSQNCSFLYFLNYTLKFPNSTNLGAQLGGILHDLLEIIANKPNKYQSWSIKTEIEIPKSINKWFEKRLNKEGLSLDNVFTLQGFFIRGFNYDFWLEGAKEVLKPELEFKLNIDEGIDIHGYMDRVGIYNDGEDDYVLIRDYKSQKKPFTSEELKNNIQAMIYLHAFKSLHPNINLEKSRVEFVMVRKQKQQIQTFSGWTDTKSAGFLEYLKHTGKYLEDFNLDRAKENMAAHSIKNRFLCGSPKLEYPGQMKEDGSGPLWCCPHRFPKDYYAVIDENGDNIRTAYSIEDLNVKEGELVKQKRFSGCPSFF